MEKTLTTIILLLAVSSSYGQIVDSLRNESAGTLSEIVDYDGTNPNTATRFNASYFNTHIYQNLKNVINATLDRGITPWDFGSVVAAKTAAKDSNWVLIIPKDYPADSILTFTTADSKLVAIDYRNGYSLKSMPDKYALLTSADSLNQAIAEGFKFIELQKGTYNYASTIQLSNTLDSLKIRGASITGVTLNFTLSIADTAIVFYSNGDKTQVSNRPRFIEFENLTIRKNGSIGAFGLYMNNVQDTYFKNVHIQGFLAAVVDSGLVWNQRWEDCTFSGSGDSTLIVPAFTTLGNPTGSNGINDIYFDGCVWEGNLGISLALRNAKSVFMTGNNKFDNPNQGSVNLEIDGASSGIIVNGATFVQDATATSQIKFAEYDGNVPDNSIFTNLKFGETGDWAVIVYNGGNLMFDNFVLGSAPDSGIIRIDANALKRIQIPKVIMTAPANNLMVLDKRTTQESILWNYNEVRGMWDDEDKQYAVYIDSAGTLVERFSIDSSGVTNIVGSNADDNGLLIWNNSYKSAFAKLNIRPDNNFEILAPDDNALFIGHSNSSSLSGKVIQFERNATGDVSFFGNSGVGENKTLFIGGDDSGVVKFLKLTMKSTGRPEISADSDIDTIDVVSFLNIINSRGGASDKAKLILTHDSASPANNDQIGFISFDANNSSVSNFSYASIVAYSPTVTAGSEVGRLIIGAPNSGFLMEGSSVVIGSGTSSGAPATSTALEVRATDGALLVPRMTTTQRDALTPTNGMIIYNTTTNTFNFRENGSWVTK